MIEGSHNFLVVSDGRSISIGFSDGLVGLLWVYWAAHEICAMRCSFRFTAALY